MFKRIKELLQYLYIKLKCSMCCRSSCSVQIGQEENNI